MNVPACIRTVKKHNSATGLATELCDYDYFCELIRANTKNVLTNKGYDTTTRKCGWKHMASRNDVMKGLVDILCMMNARAESHTGDTPINFFFMGLLPELLLQLSFKDGGRHVDPQNIPYGSSAQIPY